MRRKIFILDKQPVAREGLARIVDVEPDLVVCGQAGEMAEAVQQMEILKPDLLVVDFIKDDENPIKFSISLRNQFPHLPMLVFTSLPETLYAELFLRAGGNGYLMKQASQSNVIEAIRCVLSGKLYVSAQMNQWFLLKLCAPESGFRDSIKSQLTGRERAVFELIGKGYNTRKIAEELGMSMKTVEAHRLNIKTKLNLSDTVALVQRAIHWVHHEEGALEIKLK